MELNIVMVEPEIPQNAGNVARTCAATGARLHLVGPMGLRPQRLDPIRKPDGNFYYFSTKAQNRHTDVQYPEKVYLVFGKETAGLPEKLLFDNAEKCVRIPMIDEARSLNLSNAIAIGVYEVLRQWDYPELLESGELRNYNWSDLK